MSRPVPTEFAIPFGLAIAAAEDWVSRLDTGTFADFYETQGLSDITAYRRHYGDQVVTNVRAALGEELAEAYTEPDHIDQTLELVLHPGEFEAQVAYHFGYDFLHAKGHDTTTIVSAVQNSIRLARLLGTTKSAVISKLLRNELETNAASESSIVELVLDDKSRPSELRLSDAARRKHMLSRDEEYSCPMIGRIVTSPHTGERFDVYSLYWAASVAHVHRMKAAGHEFEL